ncbi:hypothetical protein BV210_10380 [Halorientalis sp. IM1011]|uniref:hypothetical protein n=1 Tax=Halorientalis sp. IM1011 TaxID=1932360 RepID=UPI00097CD0E8|nr:hypothetical protein [Halorientalis sp. IM1011]AQL43095.1 hypothetical protein BV210_10380 [Halorientalis sp. IM1011]
MGDRSIPSVRRLQFGTAAVVLAVLLLSGPLVGIVDLTPESRGAAELGAGTANATVVGDPTAELAITSGRFGTNVSYLRIPPASVDVDRVEQRPRLLYVVRVPQLDFERSVTHPLDESVDGRVTLRMDDRAFPNRVIRTDSYRATVIVRVQSFDGTRTIYRRNATVPVRR